MEVYQKITDYIGNTPLLELSGMEKKYGLQAKLYGKLEYCNPAGQHQRSLLQKQCLMTQRQRAF